MTGGYTWHSISVDSHQLILISFQASVPILSFASDIFFFTLQLENPG